MDRLVKIKGPIKSQLFPLILVSIVFAVSIHLYGAECAAAPSEQEIIDIYNAIAKNNPVTLNATSATFNDGQHEWTVFGAVQDKSALHSPPANWSVGSATHQILVVSEPISDSMILPYSDPVPNTISGNTLSVQACRGEYEPVSFVIRSGTEALENVTISTQPLQKIGGEGIISASEIDVRVAKAWYQAGLSLDRRTGEEKRLTPELLLHDSDLVRVDHEHQVNLVRDMSSLRDAESIVPFTIPPTTNQQIWITLHVPQDAASGQYQSNLSISFNTGGQPVEIGLTLNATVNTYELAESPIPYGLFYLGEHESTYNKLSSRTKNPTQMYEEFLDMRRHGLTQIALTHSYTTSQDGSPDFSALSPAIQLMRDAGFTTNRFLYVDWQVTDYDDANKYTNKIQGLKNLLESNGFTDWYVYSKDESTYEVLSGYKDSMRLVQNLNGKNFVACYRSVAEQMGGFLDAAILPRSTSLTDFSVAGGNIVQNEDMSKPFGALGAAWNKSDTQSLTIENGVLNKTPETFYVYFAQTVPVQPGLSYELTYEVVTGTNPGLFLATGGGSLVDQDIIMPSTTGWHTVSFTTGAGNSLRFGATRESTFQIDNVSVTSLGAQQSYVMLPWAYNHPQAGKELPGTYRNEYGLSIYLDGYKGVSNYAYQHGYHWDDWGDEVWRAHVMAYPTLDKPIPTLQWEGFREGIDDVRYQVSDTSSGVPVTPPNMPMNLKVQ